MKKLSFLLLLISIPFQSFADLAKYEITVLATNIANYGGFGEWSFSALYESGEESILFDTGFHEDTVIHNSQLLKKDLSKVEKVVLSHFHSDHTGGLLKLRKKYRIVNKKAFSKVFVAEGFFQQRFTKDGLKIKKNGVGPGGYGEALIFKEEAEKLGIKFFIVDSNTEISKDLFITGPVKRKVEKYIGPENLYVKDSNNQLQPDVIMDDQSMGMLTEKGWVMMSGCGHAGIINSGESLKKIKDLPIYGAMGGFHLWQANEKTLTQTAKWLKKEGLGKFMGGHCTGINATRKISDFVGLEREDMSHTAVGSVLTKDLEIIRSSVE